MLKKTRRKGRASCSFAQLHNKRRCPTVNSEDHVVSPGYVQLQARHQSKALILSKAAASTCGQKPGPRWISLRQTGYRLQQLINKSLWVSCLQDSSGESTVNNMLAGCVRAHAHKTSWTREQAVSLPCRASATQQHKIYPANIPTRLINAWLQGGTRDALALQLGCR